MFFAEYIWLDDAKPTKQLRSKTKVIAKKKEGKLSIQDFPLWGFDGSSTFQATGDKSDLILKPVNFFLDPLRGNEDYLVLCEVLNFERLPIESNTRALLRQVMTREIIEQEPFIGFEQEYTLYQNKRPLGWPKEESPPPQGPYYCGVGADKIFGRALVNAHAEACLRAGIMLVGTNAEVMPSQWEFQVGYRGLSFENADPLNVSDHLWVARWLLQRMAEDYNIVVSFDNKPEKGDWNGAGNHANFSVKSMRDEKTGYESIEKYINALKEHHKEHIAVYGHNLAERLTGHHETCDINTFRAGARDRGASIRIPDQVAKDRYGYIEDRRPGANCDPYLVSKRLIETLLYV